MKKFKSRMLAGVLAGVLCATAFSTTAFASGGDYYDSELPPPETAEEVPSEPLTPDGNMTLVDDIDGKAAEDKQFITVVSKNGNYFYIIIDRAEDGENTVHFLNQVDEADLLSLMDVEEPEPAVCNCKDKCAAGAVNTYCPICAVNMTECAGKEPKPEKPAEPPVEEPEKKNSSALPLLLLLMAGAGGGALYYFKFRNPKPDTKGNDDLDDYDYGEPDIDGDEEYETEDDASEQEE